MQLVINRFGKKYEFITALPNLFGHKRRTEFSNEQGQIDWNNLTYGNTISTINEVGMKMWVPMKIGRQIQSEHKCAKYELGLFCQQYGLTSVPLSRKNKSNYRSDIRKSRHYSRRKQAFERNKDNHELYRKKKVYRKKNRSKPPKHSRFMTSEDNSKV